MKLFLVFILLFAWMVDGFGRRHLFPQHCLLGQNRRISNARDSSDWIAESTVDLTNENKSHDITDPQKSTVATDELSFSSLNETYGDKIVRVDSLRYPHCAIYLCGTQHVSNSSVDMVIDVVRLLSPHYVVLELCSERIDLLQPENEENILNNTIRWRETKWKWNKQGIVRWFMRLFGAMQEKSARLTGARLGGELYAAARAARETNSKVILADRLYSVTMQRLQDRLRLRDKMIIALLLIWESVTLTLNAVLANLKSYDSMTGVQEDLDQLAANHPALADVVVFERDAYLARVISDLATIGFGPLPPPGVTFTQKGKIVVVVGAGHLPGIERHLMSICGVNETYMRDISRSTMHNVTWEGPTNLPSVDVAELYGQ